MQYYFFPVSCMLNYSNEAMKGYVSPTDSRWRLDLKSYEEGRFDESEDEKNKIEARQRTRREAVAKGTEPEYVAKFFRPVRHPFLTPDIIDTGENPPLLYELIEGDGDQKGYFERRENQDWDDMVNLWHEE